MDLTCHRCHAELPPRLTGEEARLFCPHCSAPQILLPEHMRVEGRSEDRTTGAEPPPLLGRRDTRQIDWRVVIETAAWTAGVGALLSVLGLKFQPVHTLSPFWVLAAGSIVLNRYLKQRPNAWVDARAGLRVGLVTGLLMIAAKGVAVSVTGVIARFATHSMEDYERRSAQEFAASEAVWLNAMPDLRQNTEFLANYKRYSESNEIRAGVNLFAVGFTGFFILFFSGLSGAFAGTLQRKRRLLSQRN